MSECVHGGCWSSCCVAQFGEVLHRALKLNVLVMSKHEDVASASPHLISKGCVNGWSRSELEFLNRICLQVLFSCMWVQRCPCSCLAHPGFHRCYIKCGKKNQISEHEQITAPMH